MKKGLSLYISVGGFVFKVVFYNATTPLFHYFRESLIKTIRTYYKSFILKKIPKGFDFTIQLSDAYFPKLVQFNDRSYKNRLFIDAGMIEKKILSSNYQINQFQFAHFLHFAINLLLKKSGGAVFHASSCMVDGRVHVFFAPSGGGKSTIMKILRGGRGVKPFSDEFIILRQEGTRVIAYQMPLIEKNFVPKSFKGTDVAACYFIKKSPEVRLIKLTDRKYNLECLMKQSYFDGVGAPPNLTFLKYMAFSVPFYDLMFTKVPSRQDALLKILRNYAL